MEVPDEGIYKDKAWPEPQRGHAAMISLMDRDMGRLLDKLKDLGIAENTLVVFTSDNGPHSEGGGKSQFFNSAGPLRGMKRDLYEGGIRVPAMAWWPGTIAAHTVTDHISAFWDFLPTACEAAGVEVPGGIDGISYLPTLLGKKQRRHEHLYWEFGERNGKQAVRWGKWKGVRQEIKKNPDAPIELYDLSTDLGEKVNVAGRNPEVVEKIAQLMVSSHTSNPGFKLLPGD